MRRGNQLLIPFKAKIKMQEFNKKHKNNYNAKINNTKCNNGQP